MMNNTKHQFHRLIKKIAMSRVKGLYVYMFFKNKTMNDVQSETGISRQTLSAWKKGQNVSFSNLEKIAERYQVKTTSLMDGKTMIEELIKNEPDYIKRGVYGEYLAEYNYLEEAHAHNVVAS